MIVHSVNTGSAGNCYILEINGKYLLLDCGVPYLEIARTIDFRAVNIIGCLLSHEHGDHGACAGELLRRGIKIFTSKGTSTKIPKGAIAVEKFKEFTLGEFTIIPFDVPHDAEEPFGYLIKHESIGVMAFITDAMYCKYRFPGLRHLLIEANYSDELISDNEALSKRIKHSHMSIETCCDFVELNAETLQTVTLLHLSDRNSDEEDFERKIRQVSGVRTYVAKKNMRIQIEF